MNTSLSTTEADPAEEFNIDSQVLDFYTKDKLYIIGIIIILVVIGLIIIGGNLMVAQFYSDKLKSMLPLMYFMFSCCDLLSGIACLFTAIGMTLFITLDFEYPKICDPSKDTDFCPEGISEMSVYSIMIASFLTCSFATHMSAYFSTVLAITRSIAIIFPFYRISKSKVVFSCISYGIIWGPLIAYEAYSFRKHTIYAQVWHMQIIPSAGAGALYTLENALKLEEIPEIILLLVCVVFPYVVPSLVCALTSFFQSMVLLKKTEINANDESHRQRQKEITKTILMVTVLFFVCNTTYFLTTLAYISSEDWEENIKISDIYVLFTTSIIFPFLNALINPIILIRRSSAMKTFVVTKLRLTNKD